MGGGTPRCWAEGMMLPTRCPFGSLGRPGWMPCAPWMAPDAPCTPGFAVERDAPFAGPAAWAVAALAVDVEDCCMP